MVLSVCEGYSKTLWEDERVCDEEYWSSVHSTVEDNGSTPEFISAKHQIKAYADLLSFH